MDGEKCCQVSERLLPLSLHLPDSALLEELQGLRSGQTSAHTAHSWIVFPVLSSGAAGGEFLWPPDPVPLPICRSAVWLYTYKLKDKLSYICPNTEHHQCLKQEGSQSGCGEYPPCPIFPSSTLDQPSLMSHQRWKKYSIESFLQVDSQEPFLVSACDPGCCPCPSPRRSLLNRKSSFWLLLKESLQKDHPQTSSPYDESTVQEVALTCTHCSDT